MKNIYKTIALILSILFFLAIIIDFFCTEGKSVKFYIAGIIIGIIFLRYALKGKSTHRQ